MQRSDVAEDSYICLAAKLAHSFATYAERPCVGVRPAAGAPFYWYSYRQVGDVARRLGGALRALDAEGKPADARVVAICRKRDHWWSRG